MEVAHGATEVRRQALLMGQRKRAGKVSDNQYLVETKSTSQSWSDMEGLETRVRGQFQADTRASTEIHTKGEPGWRLHGAGVGEGLFMLSKVARII